VSATHQLAVFKTEFHKLIVTKYIKFHREKGLRVIDLETGNLQPDIIMLSKEIGEIIIEVSMTVNQDIIAGKFEKYEAIMGRDRIFVVTPLNWETPWTDEDFLDYMSSLTSKSRTMLTTYSKYLLNHGISPSDIQVFQELYDQTKQIIYPIQEYFQDIPNSILPTLSDDDVDLGELVEQVRQAMLDTDIDQEYHLDNNDSLSFKSIQNDLISKMESTFLKKSLKPSSLFYTNISGESLTEIKLVVGSMQREQSLILKQLQALKESTDLSFIATEALEVINKNDTTRLLFNDENLCTDEELQEIRVHYESEVSKTTYIENDARKKAGFLGICLQDTRYRLPGIQAC
jgi:hypothetical protein